MSYPRPLICESADSLYKQAIFFYDRYEDTVTELRELKELIKPYFLISKDTQQVPKEITFENWKKIADILERKT